MKHFIKRLALVLLCTSVCCSEVLAEKVRILTLMSRFADTARDYSTSDFDQDFRAVEDLLSELSYNQSEFELTVVDMGRGNLKEQEAKNLWQTLRILGSVQYTLEQSATQDCDYDVYLPLAQAYLDSVNQLDYNYYGYDIDSLEVEKARPYGCLDTGAGELLAREMGVPADIDLRGYHILISVTVTDSESGKYAYATRLEYSGLKQAGAPIPEDIALGLRFISSPSRKGDRVEKYGHITDYEHKDPSLNPNALDPSTFVEPHFVPRKKSDQYTSGQYVFTQYTRTLAHELIHALGLGTHADGVDYWESQEVVDRISKDPDTEIKNHDLEYGDYFDLMGSSEYAFGLAPYYREWLGWLSSDRVVTFKPSESQSDVSVRGINSPSGVVAAKTPVKGGWLYVSYRPPVGYDESLLIPELVKNTQGAFIHYVSDRGLRLFDENGSMLGSGHFLQDVGGGLPLGTSILLDASKPAEKYMRHITPLLVRDGAIDSQDDVLPDLTFALQPGETFSVYGVTIENVRVEGDQLLFDVNTPKGTVGPAPNISVSTGILIFGDVSVGSSTTATVTIFNTGTAELSVSEISLSDSQFTISPSNLSLSPGSSAEVTVVFVPNSAGSKTDTLTIISNDPDAGSVSVSVFGRGSGLPVADISVSTTSLSFGDVEVGAPETASITISNTGTVPLLVWEISSSDSQFTVSPDFFGDEFGFVSPAGPDCLAYCSADVTVVFVPNSAGLKTGTLTIRSSDPDAGSVSISVSGGSELPVADISVSTTSLSFGDVEVGASETASITISNTGTAELSVSKISSSDSQFTLSRSTLSLSPGSSADVTVVFDPQEGGDQTGFLTISSDDPDRPVVTIEVAGVGLSVGDFDGDGSVGFSDFLIFAQVFGTNDTKCDIDGDGSVGFADFLLFAAEFGK